MKTILSLSHPAEVETECLVAIVLDRAEKGRGDNDRPEKDKPRISIETADAVSQRRGRRRDRPGGEVTGKPFETTLLRRPAGEKLKAKRLLLLGGGKAKTFSAFELGAAWPAPPCAHSRRRDLRSFAYRRPGSRA